MRPPHFEVASICLNFWESGAHYSLHLIEQMNERLQSDYANVVIDARTP